jgi:hypothetical protein
MPKKKLIKKHSVKANLQVVELTGAGSSLDLEIYADQEKIGTMIIGQGSLSWKGGKRQSQWAVGGGQWAVGGDGSKTGVRPAILRFFQPTGRLARMRRSNHNRNANR